MFVWVLQVEMELRRVRDGSRIANGPVRALS